MVRRILPYCTIAIVCVVSTLILWLPFIMRAQSIGFISQAVSMLDLYAHWDGPLYIIPAKTWYNIDDPLLRSGILGLSAEYFTAHLPLYPLLISIVAVVAGYLKSMLIISVGSAILYGWIFYLFVTRHHLTQKPLLLTCIALFITPRFFVIRSVGAPETLFMSLILFSLLMFTEKKYFWAGVAGALASATKVPGILLFGAYAAVMAETLIRERRWDFRWFWILLIPIGFVAVSGLYYVQTGDFFSYFHSTDNVQRIFPPFQMFNKTAQWVGTGWLEEIMLYFLIFGSSTYMLWGKKALRASAYFSTIFLIAVVSVEHRDISRYALPLVPLMIIAFEKFLTSRAFYVILLIFLPALYLYGWNFMMENRAPITDWKPFL